MLHIGKIILKYWLNTPQENVSKLNQFYFMLLRLNENGDVAKDNGCRRHYEIKT